ncbi:MAG: biotin operon repressor [Acutalibacteraceae bacterium]
MSSKSNILQILEKSRTYVSGEELAQQLQISRSAIWKAISELKKKGYQIISVTNKGYCLSDETDVISAEGIGPYLTYGSQDMIHVFKTVDSTNLVAKKWRWSRRLTVL